MSGENYGKNLAIGVLAGVAVGLAIGYLTAPRSGKETRAIIREKAEEVKDKTENTISKVKNTFRQKVGLSADDYPSVSNDS